MTKKKPVGIILPFPGKAPRARKKKYTEAPRTKARTIESYEELRALIPKPEEKYFDVLPDVVLTERKVRAAQQVATTDNIQYLLNLAGIKVRTNMMTKSMEITLPHGVSASSTTAAAIITDLMMWARIKNTTGGLEQVRALSMMHRYHPAEDWILSRPWDGRDHFTTLLSSVPAKNRDEARVYLWRWFIQCIECARGWHSPEGTMKDFVPVLVGAQGLWKTSWVKNLAPEGMVKIGSSLALGTFNDSDSIHQNTSNWIVEQGELEATFGRSIQGHLKNFFSRMYDSYRRPYERTETVWPRMSAPIATVNLGQFLRDTTGNRRYGPIVITKHMPNPRDVVDIQQLFAQCNAAWEMGEPWALTQEENAMREADSEDFVESDEIEDRLDVYFSKKLDEVPRELWLPLTYTDIARVCQFPGVTSNVHKVSTWLARKGIERKSQVTKRGISRRKCWVLPLSEKDDNNLTGVNLQNDQLLT